MSACFVIKSDPWWQKQHAVPLMLPLWLHNNTSSPVINHAESAFFRRALSLSHTHTNRGELQSSVSSLHTHTHTVIEGNYRAVCRVKTSARGRIVLRDEWSDPDGHLETHFKVQGFFICHMINYTGYNQKWNVGQIRSAQWTVQRIKIK